MKKFRKIFMAHFCIFFGALGILPAILGTVFFVLSASGCGSFGSSCDYVIQPPAPDLDTMAITPKWGIVVFTDYSGTWTVPIPQTMLVGTDASFDFVVETMGKIFNANIVFDPKFTFAENDAMSDLKTESIFGLQIRIDEIAGQSESNMETPQDWYPDEFISNQIHDGGIGEEEREGLRSEEEKDAQKAWAETYEEKRIIHCDISAGIQEILTDKNACLVKDGVWGISGSIGEVPTIWITKKGELENHELAHQLADACGLSGMEEKSLLKAVSPGIKDFPNL